jgi:uncharacterized membrane protein
MIINSIFNQCKLLSIKIIRKNYYSSKLNIKSNLKITKKVKPKNYFPIFSSNIDNIHRSHDKRIIYFNIFSLFFSCLGLVETTYLTITKLNGSFAICSSQNCTIVLDSVFSNFIGIPISIFGAFLYVCIFSLVTKQLIRYYTHKNFDKLLNVLLITIQFFLCFFSFYFAVILKTFLQTNCPWCAFSMLISSLLLYFSTISKNGNKIVNLNYLAYSISGISIFIYFLFFLNILEIISF